MLKFLRVLRSDEPTSQTVLRSHLDELAPPRSLLATGASPFGFAAALKYEDGLPVPNWQSVNDWIETIASPDAQKQAWLECEIAWLKHLRAALGPTYSIDENSDALLLSSLDVNERRATLEFMSKTQKRIERLLGDLWQPSDWEKAVLLVFDDDDTYYRYVARYYAEDGEFALSAGMFINSGCGHFATKKAELHAIEPTIAHEMTHAVLAHLPIPTWLNEGIAVNMEQRLTKTAPPLFTPTQMHAKHLRFWNASTIQEFWSGDSFARADDGNMLSYDLARILVTQLSGNWEVFSRFVSEAHRDDAGARSAATHFKLDLGIAAAALLEQTQSESWEPAPDQWQKNPDTVAPQQAICPSLNGHSQ